MQLPNNSMYANNMHVICSPNIADKRSLSERAELKSTDAFRSFRAHKVGAKGILQNGRPLPIASVFIAGEKVKGVKVVLQNKFCNSISISL